MLVARRPTPTHGADDEPGAVRRLAGRVRPRSTGAPTLADLDYHLTTLFPPVRPRGYVEIRCIDALPDRWWPALAALTAVLIDDPIAADRAAELCEPVARRAGPRPPATGSPTRPLRRAAPGCVEVAAAALSGRR